MELVAVYGTLKQGFGNHVVLGDAAEFMGEEKLSNWAMYSYGHFPFIVPTNDCDDTVHVEVYAIPNLKRTDRLEGYDNGYQGFYDRKKVETTFGDAWIYFFPEMPDSSYPRVESGVW